MKPNSPKEDKTGEHTKTRGDEILLSPTPKEMQASHSTTESQKEKKENKTESTSSTVKEDKNSTHHSDSKRKRESKDADGHKRDSKSKERAADGRTGEHKKSRGSRESRGSRDSSKSDRKRNRPSRDDRNKESKIIDSNIDNRSDAMSEYSQNSDFEGTIDVHDAQESPDLTMINQNDIENSDWTGKLKGSNIEIKGSKRNIEGSQTSMSDKKGKLKGSDIQISGSQVQVKWSQAQKSSSQGIIKENDVQKTDSKDSIKESDVQESDHKDSVEEMGKQKIGSKGHTERVKTWKSDHIENEHGSDRKKGGKGGSHGGGYDSDAQVDGTESQDTFKVIKSISSSGTIISQEHDSDGREGAYIPYPYQAPEILEAMEKAHEKEKGRKHVEERKPTGTKESVGEYLTKHRIGDLFDSFIVALIQQKPQDPVDFLHNMARTMNIQRRQMERAEAICNPCPCEALRKSGLNEKDGIA